MLGKMLERIRNRLYYMFLSAEASAAWFMSFLIISVVMFGVMATSPQLITPITLITVFVCEIFFWIFFWVTCRHTIKQYLDLDDE